MEIDVCCCCMCGRFGGVLLHSYFSMRTWIRWTGWTGWRESTSLDVLLPQHRAATIVAIIIMMGLQAHKQITAHKCSRRIGLLPSHYHHINALRAFKFRLNLIFRIVDCIPNTIPLATAVLCVISLGCASVWPSIATPVYDHRIIESFG